MICVIFAAGRGTRLQPLTDAIPKSMVDVGGRPLVAHILDALPQTITHAVIVHGWHGETIEAYFGSSYERNQAHPWGDPVLHPTAESVPIQYVDQGPLNGTAGALIAARSALPTGEPFLVLHGDNLYAAADLERLANGSLALGVYRYVRPTVKLVFDADERGYLTGAHRPSVDELTHPVAVCTGSYLLDHRIFDVAPVALADGEFGLPQTVLVLATQLPVKLFEHSSWHEVNTLSDLDQARTVRL